MDSMRTGRPKKFKEGKMHGTHDDRRAGNDDLDIGRNKGGPGGPAAEAWKKEQNELGEGQGAGSQLYYFRRKAPKPAKDSPARGRRGCGGKVRQGTSEGIVDPGKRKWGA